VQIVTGTDASRYVMCAVAGEKRPSCGQKWRRGIRRIFVGALEQEIVAAHDDEFRTLRDALSAGALPWAAMSKISNRASD